MKKTLVSLFVSVAFMAASAIGQAMPSSQGTQQSSPTMGQPGTPGQQPGYPGSQPGTTGPTMGNDQTQNQNQNPDKGEKKIKGCVQSQGGQYVLETKKGKAINLTGQDVSAHVGHEVALKGTWESGAGSNSSATAAGASGSEKVFNVAKVDMISETCGGKKGSSASGNSGGMGTPSSTGTGTGSAGSTGNSTTPPPQ